MPCIYTARVHVVVYADASIFSCRAKDCDDQSQRSSNWCVGQPNTIGLYVGHISWHLTATERDGDYTFGGCSQYGVQNIYIHPWWQHTPTLTQWHWVYDQCYARSTDLRYRSIALRCMTIVRFAPPSTYRAAPSVDGCANERLFNSAARPTDSANPSIARNRNTINR